MPGVDSFVRRIFWRLVSNNTSNTLYSVVFRYFRCTSYFLTLLRIIIIVADRICTFTSWCYYFHSAVFFVVICSGLIIKCCSFVNLGFMLLRMTPYHINIVRPWSDSQRYSSVDQSHMSAIVANEMIDEFVRALIEIVVGLNYINFYQAYYIFTSHCVSV